MQEYSSITSNRATHTVLLSIKRAQWAMVWLGCVAACVFVALGCYAGVSAHRQINYISRSVGAQLHSETRFAAAIVDALASGRVQDQYLSLLTRYGHLSMRVSTFPHWQHDDFASITNVTTYFECPASAKYKQYLTMLIGKKGQTLTNNGAPVISNIFLFSGNHGLGKSFAGQQLAAALATFRCAVALSTPMDVFDNLNSVSVIADMVDEATQHSCYLVWVFDELDSYISKNLDTLRRKTITQMAEYAGFIADNKRRVLAFTTNNGEMLAHDYWGRDRRAIEKMYNDRDNGVVDAAAKTNRSSSSSTINTDNLLYSHNDDYEKALLFTGLTSKQFLIEGQLSRLRSFIGDKMYTFTKFQYGEALAYIEKYLKEHQVPYDDSVETTIKSLNNGSNSVYDLFTMRELRIYLDDIINKYNVK
ncbi:hypothetical protein [Lambdina fiscellaria nucleopolyhedrovirus]|uniref:ATPase AAA-type core domain-containing protein n=1 Tax=Lambdina fiscellaria nucleopolyhedrovirus TaxID=1642929 RepID=A0A0E3Z892_9ABAC|nr:hypothetical protein [Lambdina fiscellaria nucleopolyhedrovirus]AKC91658.1 hypothetical protein [Lambdina fiscellaria nucleopolyhedrovirus]